MSSWVPAAMGQSAAELIASLGRHIPQLRRVSFLRYDVRPPASKRLPGVAVGEDWVPGLDILARVRHAADPEGAVRTLLAAGDRDEVSRLEWVDVQAVKTLRAPALEGQAVGLSSLCEFEDGQPRHLPLLDFACPKGSEHEHFVRAAAVGLGLQRGALVDSGASYHLYGFEPLTEVQWRDFMARSLLLAPYVDARYVAHRLLGGVGVLRVGAAPGKDTEPTVIAYLGDRD